MPRAVLVVAVLVRAPLCTSLPGLLRELYSKYVCACVLPAGTRATQERLSVIVHVRASLGAARGIFNPFLSRHSRTSVQVLAEQAPTVQHLAHHPA